MKSLTTAGALSAVAALALSACGSSSGSSAAAVDDSGKLEQVVISTYDTGTSTYADMAAVSEAMTKIDGTRTRIITSNTAIGRLTPLKKGQSQFARTGDEFVYAFEGDVDFATKDWGPTPLRVVWAPQVVASFAVKSGGAMEPADLKGKKVPNINSNPSVNDKIDAMIAAGGLTRDDVTEVKIDYTDQADALKAGRIDVMYMSTTSPSMVELESSMKIDWMKLDPKDPAWQAALKEHATTVELKPFEGAPGQKEGESDIGYWYPAPVVTMDSTSDEVAGAMTKSIVEAFPKYKDATSTTELWSDEVAGVVPKGVPFHPGTVAYLEEKKLWTPEAQKAQDSLLEREKQLDDGWKSVKDKDGAELTTAWTTWKKDNLTAE